MKLWTLFFTILSTKIYGQRHTFMSHHKGNELSHYHAQIIAGYCYGCIRIYTENFVSRSLYVRGTLKITENNKKLIIPTTDTETSVIEIRDSIGRLHYPEPENSNFIGKIRYWIWSSKELMQALIQDGTILKNYR